MATQDGKEVFTIEEKLANLNLTSTQRAEAEWAVQIAELFASVVQVLAGGARRHADTVSLKPSLKH